MKQTFSKFIGKQSTFAAFCHENMHSTSARDAEADRHRGALQLAEICIHCIKTSSR